MTLLEAISTYTLAKQRQGITFAKGRSRLLAFSRCTGNKSLDRVNTSDVVTFLGDPKVATISWRVKHQILSTFMRYWSFRGAMASFEMPPLPIPVKRTFVPHIYTKEEVRRLSREARLCESSHPASLDPRILRLLILLLYGTGAFVGQVLNLKWADVELEKGLITLRQRRYDGLRTIPVAADLITLLKKHRKRSFAEEDYVFTNKRGKQIQVSQATVCFARLRTRTGIIRQDPDAPSPRLHDMRATFAVHRIEDWLKQGKDLNGMMPALSAYMGLTGLMSSERYMDFTPGRFRDELNSLSSSRRTKTKRWRDDSELMRFLTSL